MTARIRTATVILDQEYRDEEEGVEVILNAIRMIKGVAVVEKGDHCDANDQIAKIDYHAMVGSFISELARHPDKDFLAEVTGAYAKLKKKRGY